MKKTIIAFMLLFVTASQASNGIWTSAPFASLVAWGDSLTAGNEDGSGTTYPNALAAIYIPPRTVQNQGIGGNTSSQILTRFQAAPSTWPLGTLIWSGRNNYSQSAQVQFDIATMVATLTNPNYIVLSIINGEYATSEYIGGAGYNQIVALNAALASTYGPRYLDVRSLLVAAYNPANGADVLDHANDVPPFTLRAVDTSGTIVGSLNSSSCMFTTSNTVFTNYILTVGTEYIFISGVTGNTSVTACTRGYGGTGAANYSAGQSYVGTDPIHLNSAGYTLIAQWVYAKIQALGAW